MENDKHRGGLGSRFEDFKATPSEGLWDSIADSLNGKKKRRAIIWWWFGTGMAAVGLISVMSINWQAEPTQMVQGKQGETLQHKMINNTLDGAKNNHEELISEFKKSSKNAQIDALTIKGEVKENVQRDHKLEKDLSTTELIEKKPELERVISDKINRSTYMDGIPSLELNPIEVTIFSEPMIALTAPEIRSSKWEIGLGLSHWSRFPSLEKYGLADEEPLDSMNNNSNFNNLSQTVRRSIGAKLHIGYRLGKRFRVTSGLLVERTTYVQDAPNSSSVFFISSEEDNEFHIKGNYKITSLGIPLGVEYDFIKRKRFSMGTGLNILNEIPILETYKTGSTTVADEGGGVVRNFIIGYDLGFNLNLNASYALNERLRIQANPGLRWYVRQEENYTQFNLPKRKAWFGGSVNLIWRL